MWHTLRREGYQVSRQAVATYKKRILSGAKEDEGLSSREEFTLTQGRTTVGILMGMTKLNLTVSRSMAVLTVTAAR